jgi:hypothetical protein
VDNFSKEELTNLYLKDRRSVAEIANIKSCSQNKVNYWLIKHQIKKRSIADAVYIKHNPNGDPFLVSKPTTRESAVLYGVGLGLYWGEGTKSSVHSVRLGNTDPKLIKTFILFLEKFYSIDRKKLRFGLQIFSDINPAQAVRFWKNELGVETSQFYKPLVSVIRKPGTYKKKSEYGVVTIYFNNKKMRDLLCGEIENLRQID